MCSFCKPASTVFCVSLFVFPDQTINIHQWPGNRDKWTLNFYYLAVKRLPLIRCYGLLNQLVPGPVLHYRNLPRSLGPYIRGLTWSFLIMNLKLTCHCHDSMTLKLVSIDKSWRVVRHVGKWSRNLQLLSWICPESIQLQWWCLQQSIAEMMKAKAKASQKHPCLFQWSGTRYDLRHREWSAD